MSTERTSEDQHTSIEASSGGLGMTQSQMDQMSAFNQAPTNLSAQQQQALNSTKIMKESCSGDEMPQHDSSQESIEEVHQQQQHHHHQIHQHVIVSLAQRISVLCLDNIF